MHTLKRVDGTYYADGVAFGNFRDALASIWRK